MYNYRDFCLVVFGIAVSLHLSLCGKCLSWEQGDYVYDSL